MLKALYEVSDGTYNTYALAQKLNPTARPSGEEAHAAFESARDTTEKLIEKGLVRGKRLTGADGVYFEGLKLTPKGERKAIEVKNEGIIVVEPREHMSAAEVPEDED